jgi:hypothetical protein
MNPNLALNPNAISKRSLYGRTHPLPRLARICIPAALGCSLVVLSQRALLAELGLAESRLMLIPLALYPLLLAVAVMQNPEALRCLRARAGYPVVFIGGLVLTTLWGYVQGNGIRDIILDLLGMLMVIGAYLNGASEAFWKASTRPMLVLGTLAMALAIRNTAIDAVILDRSLLGDQAGYRAANALLVIPLWAMILAQGRRSWEFYWAVALILGGIYMQFAFAKRLGSVHLLVLLAFAVVLVPLLHRQPRRSVGALVIAGIAILFLVPKAGFDRTIDRFMGSYGVGSTLTTENSRIEEAKDMLSSFKPSDWLLGRGMGGSFTSMTIDTANVSIGEDTGSTERQQLHMGILFPFLKGGLVWSMIYLWPITIILARIGRLRDFDAVTQSCILWAATYYAFQLMEGPVTYSNCWDGLALGLAIGRIRSVDAPSSAVSQISLS